MMTDNHDQIKRMLDGYEPIIRQFVDGEVSAENFESAFLTHFKNDRHQVIGEEFDVLDKLFADVDQYVSEPELRETVGGIDADALRARARSVYIRLYNSQVR